MTLKQRLAKEFIKQLETYFDDTYNDFTKQRIERMLNQFDEAIPKTFIADKASFDRGYREGYGDAKKYYIKQTC
jgi:wobble nucleotide-excising tRNase